MNILLINKEDNIQQMLIETIKRWRINFMAVTTISDAIRAIRDGTFDMIITEPAMLDVSDKEIQYSDIGWATFYYIKIENELPTVIVEKIRIFQTLKPRDEVESTGVGFSVVNKIIQMYCGRIWLEPDFGSGTTFFFTLPKERCLN